MKRTLVVKERLVCERTELLFTVEAIHLKRRILSCFFAIFMCLIFVLPGNAQPSSENLTLSDSGYFEKRGWNVLVFSNSYGLFGDEKASGIEMIHHGVRTATNGDVRLNPTPEQWDSIPQVIRRQVNRKDNSIETFLRFPAYDFSYRIKTTTAKGGVYIRILIDKPLPQSLEGKAGFNLEFLPSAYFHKSYIADGRAGSFPLYPSGPMTNSSTGRTDPLPLTTGKSIVLAPEDPTLNISVLATEGRLSLYDGRNKAQNGWFVLRSLIPSSKTGTVIEWFIKANTIAQWKREPVIAYSQVGYHPSQQKKAVIELDKNDAPLSTAKLLKVNSNGTLTEVLRGAVKPWGPYLRYTYCTFDFSSVTDEGLYILEYGKKTTTPFRIGTDIYDNSWQPTLDVYFPVAMDHMFVKEAYRVWHGKSHMDDALQAPVNHQHFDLYAQGSTTGTSFKPFDHIPGLNIGGWYDAGDFDIRTQTIYAVVLSMVQSWETFALQRDETAINQHTRHVNIHVPDGKPDLLQQIEHGVLQLLAQHKSVGYAINGIVEAHLSQYTHLGDASTKTDNLVYNPKLDTLQSDGFTSGTFDDRWAFTNKSTPLNYGSIAALAAANRALKGYNDTLAKDCLATAIKVWDEEHSHAPDIFNYGNTTGGPLLEEELKAALELLITTKDRKYARRINELLPSVQQHFNKYAVLAVRAIPYMDVTFNQKIETFVRTYKKEMASLYKQNPFGVPITQGGWAGNGAVLGFAITNYYLHKAFPQLIPAEDVYRGLNYLFGCHPGSNISLVSGAGMRSKEIAYGNNRADFSFIAGGVVPGVLILKPDFPENKEDWPFIWGENEYVVNVGASYIFLVNAVRELLRDNKQPIIP